MMAFAIPAPLIQTAIFISPQIRERKFNLNRSIMAFFSLITWMMPIYILHFCYTTNDLQYIVLYFNLVFYPYMILVFLTLFSTFLVHLFRKKQWLTDRKEYLINKIHAKKDSVFRDALRKLFHILFFIALFVALRLTIISAELQGFFNNPDYTIEGNILGISPEIIMPPWKWYGNVGFFQLVMSYALLITTFVISWLDMLRKSRTFYMPITHTMLSLLRPKELESTCSSIDMTLGFTIASFFLPPLPMMAISYIIVFSDTFASQIGMRFGKTKLPWNKAKSVQGTFAGFIVSFGSMLFVGPIWGLVCVFIFVFVDVITEYPIPLSDNLLYAILGLVLFYFLAFLGVPYTYQPWLFGF